jgi:hypothetical protein
MRRAPMLMLLILGLGHPAAAAEMRYEVFWGGFRAAEARLTHHEYGGLALWVRATGLVDSVSAFALEAEREQAQFRSHSQGRKWESLLEVDFTGTPRTVIDRIHRSEPEREPRPPVPEEMKAGTMDPLSALQRGSNRVLEGQPGDSFTLAIFDGRNRYDAKVMIEGRANARVQFIPLAGFTPKSREKWDGAMFSVVIDPSTRLPIKIVSESFTVGTVVRAIAPQG